MKVKVDEVDFRHVDRHHVDRLRHQVVGLVHDHQPAGRRHLHQVAGSDRSLRRRLPTNRRRLIRHLLTALHPTTARQRQVLTDGI